MIVNQSETGWEIIYHRAHALLAADIGGEWHQEDLPQRLIETVAAISHHDDLESEWEGNHLTPAGTPLNFTLDKTTDLKKLIEFTKNARYRGRWVALLISMHMSFLNEAKRGQSPQMGSYLDEQLVIKRNGAKNCKLVKMKPPPLMRFLNGAIAFR